MPKERTHWIVADRAYAELSPNCSIKQIITNHRDFYLAGAVLPDTLMHLFQGPESEIAYDLAHRFHDNSDNSYLPLIQAEKCHPQPSDRLTACLLGVISHIQTDTVFHPFVFNVAGIEALGRHYRLETALDIYLMRRGAIPPAEHLRDLVTDENREELVTICSCIFDSDRELPRTAISQALDLHCRFQNMYDRLLWRLLSRLLGSLPRSPLVDKKQLFYPLNLNFDDELVMKSRWKHPVSGEQCTASVEELADQAVRQTVNLLEEIGRCGSIGAALSNQPGANLLTGLHGVPQSEMRFSADLQEAN